MKAIHWVLVLAAVYESAVGVSELLSSSGSNPLSGLANAPSAGSFFQSSVTGTSNTTAGLVDLGVAAALFVYPLHKKLF